MSTINNTVRTVILSADVRTFKRSSPKSIMLSKHDQIWLRRGEKYDVGPEQTMCFDHRDHIAAQILDFQAGEPLFVLMNELKANIVK